MKKLFYLAAIPSLGLAQGIPPVTYGGFIDTYYAYDFNNPSSRDRAYTTQPSRHSEFNINLAYVEAVLKEDTRRGRIALQYGSSVDTNWAAEPSKTIQIIQEAYGGIKLADKLWMDVGIYFGHIGGESFISKYNMTYSRSLNLDYVPYYSSGARFEYTPNSKNLFQFHLMNGWQNIHENNSGKALGMKWQRQLSDASTFTYNNFLGDEKVVTGQKTRFRTYHNFIFDHILNDTWKMQATFDIGTQTQQEESGTNAWFATVFTLGQKMNEISAMSYRIEYYSDSHQSNIGTDSRNGFQVASASVNYDRNLAKDTVWRTELRGFYSKDKIYPQGLNGLNRLDGFLVTSLGISF